ncbi:Biofilm operon icaADBC HTH-type negative transcriptional regulator IcaR (plasmid) [Paracoccus marcusii]|uniref:TetR/AcrR family transcriptional regulator n=1 Tax=Paracoccus marcusii TaxID=59779 RepID=UPI001C3D096E|nr:TetR/AcrR family transcriptional regulator [Paracoccus marcusii]QXI66060.1 Biofilm operon icaADBC HTH-type negative transcriptional regulator IcaR [Paracoccus marcusii]
MTTETKRNQTVKKQNRTVKTGRKFERVRDGAAVVFLRDGYSGTSVDDISRAARVSKATLYSYFPDKSVMFREVVRAAIADIPNQVSFDQFRTGNPDKALPKVLTALAQWASSKPSLSLLRLMTAEALRFPEDAADYDRAIQAHITTPLSVMIDDWIKMGQIKPHDGDPSARQLVAMVAGHVQQNALFTGSVPTKAQRAEIVRGATRLFLSAHATPVKEAVMT